MPADPNDKASGAAAGGEEALIAEFWAPLAAEFSGAFDLKDDCATIAPAAGEELVVTTDALIAGVHFFPGDDAAAVAWKALAVNVSDLVGKGALPRAYLMNVALPELDRAWLAAFGAGLKAAQDAFGCKLIGGDTDRTPGPLTVAITALGAVRLGKMVRRSTTRPGDHVYVTGTIGDAALGLASRKDTHMLAQAGLDPAAASYLEGRFSRPHPPVAIVTALRACASAAMDVSDGLIKDFDRLCRASGVGGVIDVDAVPLSGAARSVVARGEAKLEDLLTGGEDYEVLATVAPDAATEFERLATASGVRVTRIGIIIAGPVGGTAKGASGETIAFTKTGWDHFSQP